MVDIDNLMKLRYYQYILKIRKFFKKNAFTYNQCLRAVEHSAVFFKQMQDEKIIVYSSKNYQTKFVLDLPQEKIDLLRKEIILLKLQIQ